MALHAVVLAGGSGTRFWPRSRRARPKQFIALGGERTLIQATVARLAGLVPSQRTFVVAGEAYGPLVREQLPEVPAANVLLEPAPRDTAPAIGLAAGAIARDAGPDAAIVVLPSDHRIAPTERFQAALVQAEELARSGRIVTLGVRPTRPATGYGYIRRGAPIAARGPFPAFDVAAFEEKPDLAKAQQFIAARDRAWNGGIFIFTARAMLDALARHLPAARERIDRIVAARGTPDAAATLVREWREMPRISIDYAVLEKSREIAVIDVDFDWSDVGSWDVAAELFPKDASENGVDGASVVAVDSAKCVVAGDGRLIALLGVDDLMVIQSGDATLVCPRARAEDVKKLVQEIERRGLGDRL